MSGVKAIGMNRNTRKVGVPAEKLEEINYCFDSVHYPYVVKPAPCSLQRESESMQRMGKHAENEEGLTLTVNGSAK
jgi:hypothetical protein